MRKSLLAKIPLVVLLLIAAGIIVFFQSVPTYVIGTGSMAPTLPVGTLVTTQPAGTLHPGDIITFQQKGMSIPVTHTFIGYGSQGEVLTKGDANQAPDVRLTPLTMDDVKGRLWFAIVMPIGYIIAGLALTLLVACMLYASKLLAEEPITQESAPAPVPV